MTLQPVVGNHWAERTIHTWNCFKCNCMTIILSELNTPKIYLYARSVFFFFWCCCTFACLKMLNCKFRRWAAVCMSSSFLFKCENNYNNNNNNNEKASGLALIDVTGWDAVILTALDRRHQPYITTSSSNRDSWQLWAEKPRSSIHAGGSKTFLKGK